MFTFWDIALIVVVSVMGCAIAYVRDPEHKAFVLMLPFPFTLATLALGRPVDATNVLAIVPSFGFTFGVWLLHVRCRLPILAAISLSTLAYLLAGAGLNRIVPASHGVFWFSVAGVFVGGLLLIRSLPFRAEPRHRTPLPVWIKLPAIALVITVLVALKQHLGGFMTMFPMVGTVAAYEARHSLWALVRRFPWVVVMVAPMMGIVRLAQDSLGIHGALFVAWLPLLLALWFLRHRYGRPEPADTARDPANPADGPIKTAPAVMAHARECWKKQAYTGE